MRKLAAVLVLAALLAPAAASAQLSLGARFGVAYAFGEEADGLDLSDDVRANVPIQFDLGFRPTPRLTLGGYVSLGFGIPGDDLEDDCDLEGVECTIGVYRLGLQLQYAFSDQRMKPWIGGGLGYEWAMIDVDYEFGRERLWLRGPELNLQGGLDWRIGGSKFSLGPFAMLSFGRYSRFSIDSTVDGDDEGEIEDKSTHQWLQLGVRGRFDL